MLQTEYKGTAISTPAVVQTVHMCTPTTYHSQKLLRDGTKLGPFHLACAMEDRSLRSDLHGHLHYWKPEGITFGKTNAICGPTPVALDSGGTHWGRLKLYN